MKCQSIPSFLHSYADEYIVLKVGRVAIITRGRFAGKKVRNPRLVTSSLQTLSTAISPLLLLWQLTPPCQTLGRHNPTARQRLQITPLPARPRRRHRAVPVADHAADVQGAAEQAVQGEAIYQDDQLQPLDADALHARARGAQRRFVERHVQGGLAAGRRQKDGLQYFKSMTGIRSDDKPLKPAAK